MMVGRRGEGRAPARRQAALAWANQESAHIGAACVVLEGGAAWRVRLRVMHDASDLGPGHACRGVPAVRGVRAFEASVPVFESLVAFGKFSPCGAAHGTAQTIASASRSNRTATDSPRPLGPSPSTTLA